jgi:transcriptional regulator with XRE-family HTH domain
MIATVSIPAMRGEPLGTLLRRLREERGLRQRELADLAGYGDEVIAKLEQGRGSVRTLTARALFDALAKARPLTETEAHDFLAGCRVIPAADDRRLPPDEYARLMAAGYLHTNTLAAQLSGQPLLLTPAVHAAAAQLQARLGAETAARLFMAMAQALAPPPGR